jgi:hypothetical protein
MRIDFGGCKKLIPKQRWVKHSKKCPAKTSDCGSVYNETTRNAMQGGGWEF